MGVLFFRCLSCVRVSWIGSGYGSRGAVRMSLSSADDDSTLCAAAGAPAASSAADAAATTPKPGLAATFLSFGGTYGFGALFFSSSWIHAGERDDTSEGNAQHCKSIERTSPDVAWHAVLTIKGLPTNFGFM